MFQWLRQLQYPKEFRIARPSVSAAELQNALQTVIEALNETHGAPFPTVPGKGDSPAITPAQLAELATGLWRLREGMLRVEPNEGRPASRHLEAIWDLLMQAGFEIQDHTRSPYDPGLSLKVLAFQPTPGLARETVIETIKPTIYWNDERIQMGEVIVGTPA